MVLGPYSSLPCQGPLVDFVTAIVSAHHSQSLWGSIHWRGVESPSCPFERTCPSLRKAALTMQVWESDGNEAPSSCSIPVFKQ